MERSQRRRGEKRIGREGKRVKEQKKNVEGGGARDVRIKRREPGKKEEKRKRRRGGEQTGERERDLSHSSLLPFFYLQFSLGFFPSRLKSVLRFGYEFFFFFFLLMFIFFVLFYFIYLVLIVGVFLVFIFFIFFILMFAIWMMLKARVKLLFFF